MTNKYARASTLSESYDVRDIVESMNNGTIINETSEKNYKSESDANPLSSNIFCADPTSVEYNGRLYVYGTSDNQECEAVGEDKENCYGNIFSLEVFSTDDMVNWTYHEKINVKSVAPWIKNSWAPSIVSRKEADDQTHFYMYFSNNGCGVGVITATNPLGPWTDPLGKPLVSQDMKGLTDCPSPFDPGVVIDDDGIGWLTFGGGNKSDYMSTTSKIVKLNADMISFASDFVGIPTPYFNEASELNYINGTYVYTYNNCWQERKKWDYNGYSKPHECSMAYMTSKTPLDPDSWVYRGEYLLNAGDSGEQMDDCNNHSHLTIFNGKWYLLHHTLILRSSMGIKGGFRSICCENINLNENTLEIPLTKPSRKGVSQVKSLNPFELNSGSTMFTSAEIKFEKYENGNMAAKSMKSGAWTYIKGVDFDKATAQFLARVKGTGKIEVRLDNMKSEPVSTIEFSTAKWQVVRDKISNTISGTHDVYFVFSSDNLSLESWQFSN